MSAAFQRAATAGGRLTVDLAALVDNWRHLARLAAPAECGAVVKADAYGCGIAEVSRALFDAGCRSFFVALVEEGIVARQAVPQARIFLLNGLFDGAEGACAEFDLLPVLGTPAQIKLWSRRAQREGRPLPCALQLETGMNRLGLTEKELDQLLEDPSALAGVDPQLVMTHYCCADDIGHPKALAQRERFVQIATRLPGVAMSAANSAAILQDDGHGFDLARPGIALYGGEALNDVANPMKPVVTLEARIIRLREVMAGETVGYGAAQVMTRPTRVAHVSVGYADGYHRAASRSGVGMRAVSAPVQAAFRGQKIDGVGRISMDMAAFDITNIDPASIAEGDWIELFGPTIPVDDVARAAGTIGYELLTAIGSRYERRYLGRNS